MMLFPPDAISVEKNPNIECLIKKEKLARKSTCLKVTLVQKSNCLKVTLAEQLPAQTTLAQMPLALFSLAQCGGNRTI
jgi:hypothetical protein